MKLTDWLNNNGYGHDTAKDGLIHLTGEWISDYDTICFDNDATIEHDGNDYTITDSFGVYRLTQYDGNGPNGAITDVPSPEVDHDTNQ